MARTPLETTQDEQIINPEDAPGLPAVLEDAHQLSLAQAASLETMDAFIALGRIQSSQFHATVAEKMIVETAINVRDGKKYKGLPYKKESGEFATVATFEEFCEVFLGKSYRRVMELIKNYNMLGSELYEQAERLGFRQRDYNALKALPADDRKLIAQAIEEENLDKALEIMQEMAAKHAREKETLARQSDELAHSLEAKDKVIQDKTEELNRKAEQLAMLETKKRNEPAPTPEQCVLDARATISNTALHLKVDIATRMMSQAKALLMMGKGQEQFVGALIIDIKRELEIIIGECGLPTVIDDNPVPEWMRGTEFDPNQPGD